MLKTKIVIAGAGAIGTALGNVLASKSDLEVVLLSIEHDVIESVNNQHINLKYFPGIPLNPALRASADHAVASQATSLFFAVPSVVVNQLATSLKKHIGSETILVNLAKGYGNGSGTVAELLNSSFHNPVVSFKGPAFARELISNMPTGFTVGSTETEIRDFFSDLVSGTCIHIDFTDDLRGVELVSILKNIYAIALGIVDAHFNSPNLRFLVLTRAFNEMRKLLRILGGREETLFHYCGIGDFGLTALNDLSRNRTLGLLIGKGFFTETISDKVVLEGKLAIEVIRQEIRTKQPCCDDFPIFRELHRIFSEPYDMPRFVSNILQSS